MDFLENEINRYAKLKKLEVQSFKEREEFRKEFVGNVAHELKTPLFTVQGYISTLLDGAMDNPEILKKYLQRADKGVERLIYIVQDLDLITKIEFGENKLSKSNFDIIVLIKNIFEDLEMKAKKKIKTTQDLNLCVCAGVWEGVAFFVYLLQSTAILPL